MFQLLVFNWHSIQQKCNYSGIIKKCNYDSIIKSYNEKVLRNETLTDLLRIR